MYSIFKLAFMALVAVVFIAIGVAFDKELREKYHDSVPIALIATGSVMALLVFLGWLQMSAFKKGDIFGWLIMGDAIKGVLNIMFSK